MIALRRDGGNTYRAAGVTIPRTSNPENTGSAGGEPAEGDSRRGLSAGSVTAARYHEPALAAVQFAAGSGGDRSASSRPLYRIGGADSTANRRGSSATEAIFTRNTGRGQRPPAERAIKRRVQQSPLMQLKRN